MSNFSQTNSSLLHFPISNLSNFNENYNLNHISFIQNESQMTSNSFQYDYSCIIESTHAQQLLEERRRRNAFASAKFRIRKRERENSMIEKCKNYEIKVKELQNKIINLEKQLKEKESKDKRTTIEFILNN